MKIPRLLNRQKKYGLLISDAEVTLLSWHQGELQPLGLFSNDETGVIHFADFLHQHAQSFRHKAFHILVNIIGEDYRFEKVAHLLGKYKTDFHARRMHQLFRGSQLTMATVQGREERGQREDRVLFSGVLTEDKVMPWLAVVSRTGERCVAGVHMVSQVTESLLRVMGGRHGHHLVMTIHERGVMRQTYYVNGHLRFSRVAKINDDSAEQVGAALHRELERTWQYFHSLKISVPSDLMIHMVAPSRLVAPLRDQVASGEKIRFTVYDVAIVARKIGLKKPSGDGGKDSSLALHIMFTTWRFPSQQLAKMQVVTYYWSQLAAKMFMALVMAYGLYAYSVPLTDIKNAYWGAAQDIMRLQEKESELRHRYEVDEAQMNDQIPSSPYNMRAVSQWHQVMNNISVSPLQLLYFLAEGLGKNSNVRIDHLKWYLANEHRGGDGAATQALISGGEVYQILEVRGELMPQGEETYIDVAQRFDKLYDSFTPRHDLQIDKIEFPTHALPADNLSGSLSGAQRVDAPRDRHFVLRMVWQKYSQENLAHLAAEI